MPVRSTALPVLLSSQLQRKQDPTLAPPKKRSPPGTATLDTMCAHVQGMVCKRVAPGMRYLGSHKANQAVGLQ